MRTVAEHLAAVLEVSRPVAPLDAVLADAEGCVLAEDVRAPQDVPMRSLADCDGYAVRTSDVGAPGVGRAEGASLPVVEDVPVTAGEPLQLVPGATVLVASGAPVPYGADAVVPLGQTDRGRARVVVNGGVEPGSHIRRLGQDVSAGQVVLARGTRLAARHLAVAAATGRSRLLVHPRPRVVVLTVGDELVEPGRGNSGDRRPDVNGHALAAAAREAGASAVRVGPISDDRAALREAIADQLVRADLLVLTGGLSAGPWDTVADVLAPLGTVRLDHVAIAPGGRQGFGTVQGGADVGDLVGVGALGAHGLPVPFFALPGHPVAAMVAYEVFVRPALRAMAGYANVHRQSVRAALARPFVSTAGLRQFVPVTVSGSSTEGYIAQPVGGSDSSVASFAAANALLVVAEDTTRVYAGDTLPCVLLGD